MPALSPRTGPPGPRTDDNDLWLPPRGLRRYAGFQMFGGLLLCAIFVGWIVQGRSHLAVRAVWGTLAAATVWTVARTVARDRRRQRGRQLAARAEGLAITSPERVLFLPWSDIARGRWQSGPTAAAGLWLYDERGDVLARLDPAFLADEAEARAFLRWARARAPLDFPVRWSQVAGTDGDGTTTA